MILRIIALFVFYPIAAPMSLLINCFYITTPSAKMNKKLKKYIDQAPVLEGGVEARREYSANLAI